MEQNLKILFNSIYKEIPSLVYSDELENHDEQNGFILKNDLIIPESPMLNHVLKWHSLGGRDKYSHFEVSKGEAYFSIYDGEEVESILWDLSKMYLHEQSDELLNWLLELV